MKSLLFLLTFICHTAYSKIDLSKISLNPNRDSYILNTMLSHLTNAPLKPNQSQRILKSIQVINQNSSNLSSLDLKLTVDTGLSKSILNFDLSQNKTDISIALINSCQDKLKKNMNDYSEFSLLIINRIISDYRPFIQNQMLNNYKKPKYRNSKNFWAINRIKILNTYLSNKILFFSTAKPKDFEAYVTEIIITALEDLAAASFAFRYHGFLSSEPMDVFLGTEAATTKDQAATSQTSPSETIKSLELKAEEQSSEIDELIENVSPINN